MLFRTAALLLVLVFASSVPFGTAQAGEGREASPALRRQLGAAWTMIEAGNLVRATEIYLELLGGPEGRDHAEVYYGLSLIGWERRSARDAYQWLIAARRGEREWGSGWNPGINNRWQRRIEDRLRFIETNFTLKLLRPPERGEAIPPLADPPPSDPVLAEFAATIPELLEVALQDEGRLVFLLLPNGSWWVGDRLEWHEGGAMEPTQAAEGWELAARTGRDEQQDIKRKAEMAVGGSLGRELIGKLMIARRAPAGMVQAELRRRRAEALAKEYARRRPQLEALRARQQALVEAGKRTEADELGLGFGGRGGQTLLTWNEVSPDTMGDVSRELGEVWTDPAWHLRYAVVFPSKSTKWSLELPDLGVLVRIEKGGELLIQGTNDAGRARVRQSLAKWHLGARPNRVDVWFDGRQLKVSANGEVVGPVAVTRFAPDGSTRWRLATNDESAMMFDVRVEAFPGF
ncbi:MAG: hypothetical protein KDA24_09400 [Deltaproteobacteria bacterium]|nr:hypothetical protein [Deltaproteobacteria bacterium]